MEQVGGKRGFIIYQCIWNLPKVSIIYLSCGRLKTTTETQEGDRCSVQCTDKKRGHKVFFILLSATELKPLGILVYRTPAVKTPPRTTMITTWSFLGWKLMPVEIKHPEAYSMQPKA